MSVKTRFQISLPQVLWLDYPAYNALLFPVILWLITGILAAIDYSNRAQPGGAGGFSSSTQAVFVIAVLLTLVCVPLALMRLKIFWQIWQDGIEIQGKVTQTLFQRDKGQIFFTYRHKEYEYKARIVLHKTRRLTALKKDQKVALVIRPQDPKQVMIRDLYLKERR